MNNKIMIQGMVEKIIPNEQYPRTTVVILDRGFIKETGKEYETRIAVDFTDDKNEILRNNIYPVGTDVDVTLRVSSREWNGKYFTNCYGVSISKTHVYKTDDNKAPESAKAPEAPAPVQAPAPSGDLLAEQEKGEHDDLPF